MVFAMVDGVVPNFCVVIVDDRLGEPTSSLDIRHVQRGEVQGGADTARSSQSSSEGGFGSSLSHRTWGVTHIVLLLDSETRWL